MRKTLISYLTLTWEILQFPFFVLLQSFLGMTLPVEVFGQKNGYFSTLSAFAAPFFEKIDSFNVIQWWG